MVKLESFDGEVLKIREIANTLKVTYLTAYRWVRHGKIPAFKIGRHIRVKRADFEAWLKEFEIEPEEIKTVIESL